MKKTTNHMGNFNYSKQRKGDIFIDSEDNKLFLARRSKTLSEVSAIEAIAQYGFAPIYLIGKDFILQKNIDFTHRALELDQLTNLLRLIHNNINEGKTLVHGDFGQHNTTFYNGEPRCFDFEYTHWGNPYIDIGRMVLREMGTEEEVIKFFFNYLGNVPRLSELRNGFIAFCQRQYKMRAEKNSKFMYIPLERAKRLSKSKSNFSDLIKAFRDSIET